MGGQPDLTSGAWGGFARLVEGGAKLFGKSAAISALEEGEDHGKRLYEDNISELTEETKAFIPLTDHAGAASHPRRARGAEEPDVTASG